MTTHLKQTCFLGLGLVVCLWGCRRAAHDDSPGVKPDGGAQTAPVDRLAPGELAQSQRLVYGFRIPQGMVLRRSFQKAVHLLGHAEPHALIKYVSQRVAPSTLELRGNIATFPSVRILGGDPGHRYRIEIVEENRSVRLSLFDITPPPPILGLSTDERWRRAGLKPDGTLLAPDTLK